ncbi:hypothetical protein ACROYT_G042915 [Oculina patagonica]
MEKVTEDWRKALDKNLVVGIVFVDFQKAFDSISHSLLLQKLQGLGIAGDLWSWIKDYLSNRTQVTIINGIQSNRKTVEFGVPKGSVLGPCLFALFCNDLPTIIDDREGELHMYADDTTIYVASPSPDTVASVLNSVLRKLYRWCCHNSLTPHPGKTEYMLLQRGSFIGPLQGIKLGDNYINHVNSTRCLGVKIDNMLKWNVHVKELCKCFSKKLNLLRSLYFLPVQGFPDPSIASTSQEGQAGAETRTLRVTLLSSEWRSSTDGDVSTINRELAIQLAKHPNVQVSVFLPQCSEEDKNIAASHKVQLIEAEKMPGVDPVDWLIDVPENHAMDCIIGHGVHLGRQIPIIKRQHHHFKWIQVVHNAPEELGMYKSISEGEQMQQTEIELCELADQVVAVGPKLADAYKRYLRSGKKQQEVLNLTPSIFTEFLEVKQAIEERETFCVLVIGSGDREDFNLKGYDLAAQAIAELKDKSYQLRFVCAPTGKGSETAEKLLQYGIARNQLIVRSFKESREVLARLFCEVDLAIMPSRTEGFGLTALEALSACLPVLVSGNSGLGEALKKVLNGSNCVVDSEDPRDWAKAISHVRQKKREVRLGESQLLREKYLEKYTWQEPCDILVEKMQDLVFGTCISESRPFSTEKDKRPLPFLDNLHPKRLREELTGCDPEGQGSLGFISSSVELNQLPSTVASQTYEERPYQRSNIQSSFGHCRPGSSLEHSQLPFMAVTQSPTQMYQTSHTQSSSGHSRPASSEEHRQLPFAVVKQPPTQLYQTSHTQRFPGFLLPSVGHSQLSSSVASQIQEGHLYQRNQIQVGQSQLPFSAASQTHGEPTFLTSHHPQGPPGHGWPQVVYNPLPFPAGTQTYGETAFHGLHMQMQGSFGYGLPHSSVISSQLPFGAATPTHREPTFQRSHQTQSHGLSVFLRILKAEYNRRSLLKPLLWENTVKLPLEEVYTRLSIVSRRKTDFQLQSNEVNMYDIFKTLNKGQDAMVLVEGSPGIGKTTFCQKLSYDWANENIPNEFSFPVFQLMLLLKCRDINGDVMEVISEQLLPEDTDDKVKKEIMDYIKDVHNQEKILIILDGLDELSKTAEQHVDKLLHRRILPFCYVLATSRQERGIVVRQQVDFDILLQIEGFTEEDAFDYIRKHFRHFGPEHLSKGERLIKAIQENTFLHALPSNPLNLLLLCVVFEQYQGDLPSSRTELYQIIVRCLLRRYCAKQKLKVPDDDKALEKQFEDSLLTLGELAWRCLQKDRHSFCEEELTRFESNNKDLAARKIGLVFKEASVKRINPQHEYHFFHKTFQEYLAALYLAHKILKEEVNVDFQLEFYKDITGKYRQVFLFVSGILGDDASVLFRQIGKMLKSKHWDWNKCSKEEATFFTESFNESRNAEQVAMALCSFIPFPLTVDLVCSRNGCTGVLTVVNACKSFSQLQHPLHLTVTIKTKLTDSNTVVDFLASWPHLRTLSFSIGFLSVGPLADTLFTALSKKSTLTSFTDQLLQRINDNTYWRPDFTLAASKTATTVTLKLADEQNEAWAITLTGLSPDTPLTSVVLKIYSSTSNTAMQTLKNVLSNKYITSLVLIIYGEMTDSQATAVRERLAAKGILKSLTLIVYGKLSYNGAVSLKKGLLENSSLNSLKVKVFGELPDNWVTITENVLVAKKPLMSVTVHPSVTGNITEEQVVCLCRAFKLQSLTLSLWGELSCSGAEALCKLLMESSTSCVTLNIHGNVSDDVADCFLRHLKLCKTLSTLSINIWGELTKEGNSALQELSCNQRCSFALIAPSSTSDEWICKDLNFSTTYVSQSLTSVLSKLKDTSKKKLSLVIPAHGYMSGDWARGLGDGLAKNTSLTTLSLKFDSCSDMSEDWARGLGDGLAKNTSLTTLSLKFDSCSDMSEDWARGLGNGLAKNTSLTTLSLTFNSCNVMFGFWDLGLGNCLANNTSLTTLSLTFNSCIDMSKVWDLNNTSLTTLSLTFDSCIDMSEDWDLGLGDGLANNTSLTTLSLTFNSYCDTSEDWGLGLGNGLANNTSLTTLSLTFDSYYDMSGDWGLGLGNGLANNTSLTTLSLTFDSYCDMNGDWGLGLGDGLANNTSLTTLSLTFDSYCDMSEDWGLGLGNGLANNTSLTTLSLTFDSYCDMSGDWGLGLGNGLANNTSLTTLSLTFDSYCDMSGDWGLGLGNGLANNTSLTTLSVTFDSYSVMSGDWARGLDNGLANNTSLTTLSLTFNSCFDMSGDWAHGLGDGLAKNTSLTLLSVTFNNYVGSTGDWVRGLGDGLAKNASLTTLSLTLNSHSDLSEDWASGLGDGLAKNTSLASVSVTLNDYSGMSEDWLNNLCDSLAKSDTIASLSLTINYYSDTSKLLGCDLSKCLANCKSLTSLNLTVSLYGESIEC